MKNIKHYLRPENAAEAEEQGRSHEQRAAELLERIVEYFASHPTARAMAGARLVEGELFAPVREWDKMRSDPAWADFTTPELDGILQEAYRREQESRAKTVRKAA